jgi:hypothetical protein
MRNSHTARAAWSASCSPTNHREADIHSSNPPRPSKELTSRLTRIQSNSGQKVELRGNDTQLAVG